MWLEGVCSACVAVSVCAPEHFIRSYLVQPDAVFCVFLVFLADEIMHKQM